MPPTTEMTTGSLFGEPIRKGDVATEPTVHVVGGGDNTRTYVVVLPTESQASTASTERDERVQVVYKTYASDVYDGDWTAGWWWWMFLFVCLLFFLPLLALSSAWYTT